MAYIPPLNGGRLNASIGGNSTSAGAGYAMLSTGTMLLAGGNNITLSQNGGSITISAPNAIAQSNQTVGLYGLGNTTQNSSTTLDARSLSFNGLGGATVGYSNGSIQISSPVAQTNQTVGLYGLGNTTQNSSTTLDARSLSFNGLGAATVGYSNGSIQLSVPTQTNQSIGIYGLGNTTQSSSGTRDARSLSFNGLGGISVGYSNGSIQLSGPQTVAQTNQTVGLYGLGNTTQNSSTTLDARSLSFNGLGAATVGYSNGSIQISAPTQTVQTQNLMTVNGTQGAVSISGGNNVTVGNNASTITISAANQTNQTVGLYGLGNTTQNSSTTLDARTLSFNGLGGATVGYSNGSIQISAPTAAPAQTNQTVGIYATGANTTGQSSSNTMDARSFIVSGQGMYAGMSGNTLQLSVATTYAASNHSHGNPTLNLTNLSGTTASASNGLTLSLSAGAQSNQTVGLYGLGNTTQNSSTTLDARTLSFNGLGGATVGYSNGSIQISAPTAAPAQTNQTVGLYALGNTTQNSSTTLDARTLSFNGLGAATVGYSNGSIQISAPTQTVQTQNMVSVNGSSGNISFDNAANVKFGFNASTVTASYSQTNQNMSLYALGNTTQNSSTLLNASNISFNGLGNVSVGYSNGSVQISGAGGGGGVAMYDGAASITSGTARFSNLNGVSFGFNGQTITGSVAAQTAQTLGLYASGVNTLGQSSSSTLDARSFNFSGQGAVSVGYSGSTMQISAPAQTVQTQNLVSINGSTGNVSFDNAGNVDFGMNASTVTASYSQTNQNMSLYALGNTTQNSSTLLNASNLSFNGIGGVTVGYSNGSVQISGATGGAGGGIALANTQGTVTSGTAYLNDGNGGAGAITISSAGQSFNFSVPQVSTLSATGAVSISANGGTISIGAPIFGAGVSSLGNTAGNTGPNTLGIVLAGGNNITLSQSTNTNGATVTVSGAAGANTLSRWEYPENVFGPLASGTIPQGSLSLQHVYVPFGVTGTSAKIGGSISVGTSTAAATGSANMSLWMGIYTLNGSTLSLASSGSANNAFSWQAASSVSSTSLASVSGMRQLTVPMAVNMTPGEYWMGAVISSATTATNATLTLYGNSLYPTAAGGVVLSPLGSHSTSAGAARDVILGQGIHTAQTSAGPATIAISVINNTSASNAHRAAFYHVIYNATY